MPAAAATPFTAEGPQSAMCCRDVYHVQRRDVALLCEYKRWKRWAPYVVLYHATPQGLKNVRPSAASLGVAREDSLPGGQTLQR